MSRNIRRSDPYLSDRNQTRQAARGIGAPTFLILCGVICFAGYKIADKFAGPDSPIRIILTNHIDDMMDGAKDWLRERTGMGEEDRLEKQNADLSRMVPEKPSYVLRPPDAIDFNDG